MQLNLSNSVLEAKCQQHYRDYNVAISVYYTTVQQFHTKPDCKGNITISINVVKGWCVVSNIFKSRFAAAVKARKQLIVSFSTT